MFKVLNGMDHTRAYLKDKEYRKQFKEYKQSQINEYTQLLSNFHTCTIETGEFTYILTPSFYNKKYQLTMFNSYMLPLSHRTYETIEELTNDQDNAFLYLKNPVIKEYLLKEVI